MEPENAQVPTIKDIRQRRVRELIRAEFEGKQSQFAEKIGKADNYVSRILSNGPNRKGIGETLARDIEAKCGKSPRWLDDVSNDARTGERRRNTLFGLPISEAAVTLGRDWDKLVEPLKTQIAELIQTLAAAQIRLERRQQKPHRDGDHPRA
jgi:transcriptional regulator with XRE-family HTH domain